MAVDEQIERAWRRLIGPDHSPDYDDTPDPAEQPWEWVKAFKHIEVHEMNGFGWDVAVGWSDELNRADFCRGETPEAALESAIRQWEARDA